MNSDGRRKLTVIVMPDGGPETHTIHVTYKWLRVFAVAASALAFALTVMAGSWWYLAARASRVADLEFQLQAREGDRARVLALARQLESIEVQYGDIRELFGSSGSGGESDVWLPPASGLRRGRGAEAIPGVGASLPSVWPLTEKGFVTQALIEGVAGNGKHPGLDIAVPTDSYIRAAGGGTVVDVGEDRVYGRFVVLDHGGGYSTVYAHASLHLVGRGQRVREREVIALSGSTGRSTAPHLHFEILLDGEAVDPLGMVEQPG